jgi:methyl-accepting chemotaxis protein
MSNLRIGTRLWLAFIVMIVFTGLVGGLAVFQIAKVNSGVEQLAENWMTSIRMLSKVHATANDLRRTALRHVLEVTPEGKKSLMAKIEKDRVEMEARWTEYLLLVSSEEKKTLSKEIRASIDQWLADDAELLLLSQAGAEKFDQARAFAGGKSAISAVAALGKIKEGIDLNNRGGFDEKERAKAVYKHALITMSGLLAVACGVGLWFAWVITRSVVVPINRAVEVANTVASGDLTSSIAVQGKDEAADLLQALGQMQESLVKVVSNVRQNSEAMAAASSQISQGNSDLSHRTEEQASALQQTAATMEQLSSTVRNNADNAKQANQLAHGAATVASEGGQVMGQVVSTMSGINDSSRKIGDIIGVIDGIAFQTNILALNAAVEAARAGEQGRGFAVVASEVRSLAQRSAEAAKEIKALIGRNVQQVEQGMSLVEQAGKTMEEIVGSIGRVSAIVAEITTATVEQSNGIHQVGDALGQMDQSTQQNSALVEQTAAAADSMKTQSQQLVQVVAVFKVNGLSDFNYSTSPVAIAAPVKAAKPAMARKPAAISAARESHKAHAPSSVENTASNSERPAAAKAGADDWTDF